MPQSKFALRAQLEDMVLRDLLGPAGGEEEEVDESRVTERYLVGMLAPRKQQPSVDERDVLAEAGADSVEEGATEVSPSLSGTLFPSSFGMTFTVDGNTRSLHLTAQWGWYQRQHSDTATDKGNKPKPVWKRTPISGEIDLPLHAGDITPWMVSETHPEVHVTGTVRAKDGDFIVTLFLCNEQEEPGTRKDEAWLFQPTLSVEAPDQAPIFCRRMAHTMNTDKLDALTRSEREAMGMLYRRQLEFAVGHGVSVQATPTADGQRATRIATAVAPVAEVPRQTPPTVDDIPALATLELDMRELADTPAAQLIGKLQALPDAYAAWITDERAKIADPAQQLADHVIAANQALDRCERALARIREGIDLLVTDPHAAEAFRFANRAMWLQRTHSIYAREARKPDAPTLDEIDIPKNRRWYPFQLAFMLMNLPSVTVLDHPERSDATQATADLLWFPTGGGKTEAYLGLAAYTMGLRRLQGEIAGRRGDHGIAVLMRYTLRLLTLQQFQRATALICACETIRRDDVQAWGEVPFRIGLWVGMRATPNTTDGAEEAIGSKRGTAGIGGLGTPAQLTYCPWCGTEIDEKRHITAFSGVSRRGRTVIYCGDSSGTCPFSERQSKQEGIPALVVDEEIYRNPPTMLVATVDKFAQMPWKGEVQMLFGQVNGLCTRHGFRSPDIEDANSHPPRNGLPPAQTLPHGPLRPPDLIIQDELHLISGPLGSLVGLYETAVDELASWTVNGHRIRPKVIASTATIRRAQDQVNKIFLRQVEVFPPHGLDVSDNFFSMQREPSDETPGRRYLGICAIGKRYPAALIRVYVAFLAAAQKLYQENDEAADPWMTLVGYFNSIREMGGTRRLVEDDISSRLRDADERGLAKRRRPWVEELTSRRSGVDIPRILERLDIGFSLHDDQQREQDRKAGRKVELPRPIDVVLATNMISVGVDVNRLGLMVVAGQPKSTAEYIQATSRVGRSFPGLVCTVYNWARPRDMSHYERFEHYHATFYQHVEALSVTPFAPRALDRGLSGVLVSLVRLAADRLNANADAGQLQRQDDLMAQAFETIVQRVRLVEKNIGLGDDVSRQLEERRDYWLKEVERAVTHRLGYKAKRDGVTVPLLSTPSHGGWELFTCLTSLRDVEPTVNLILADDYGLDPHATGRQTDAEAGGEA